MLYYLYFHKLLVAGLIIMKCNNKIIVLTENQRLYHALANVIKEKKCIIDTSIPALSDLNLIKTQLKVSKNTSFLRVAYSEFLKTNNSLPLAIIMEYKIDVGLEKAIDPDKKKILRAFLISNVTYTKSHSFNPNSCINMIFIGGPGDARELDIIKDYPHLIFKTVKTTNESINSFLEYYTKNPTETKKIFHFDYIIIDETNDVVGPSRDFEKILDGLLISKEKMEVQEKIKDQTPIMEGDFEPAKIMYKISDARLYVDGEIFNIENKPKFDKYQEGTIYIVGYYVNNTVQEVNRKLDKFLTEDLPKIKKITPEDKIILSLNSHTIIDGATTHALNTLLSYKLYDFKNIHILTSAENQKKIKNSPGFISLRKFINEKI